jgi:hypothetical protein
MRGTLRKNVAFDGAALDPSGSNLLFAHIVSAEIFFLTRPVCWENRADSRRI